MPKTFDKIDSTQAELKRNLESLGSLPHLDWIQAIAQTEAKGRQDRAWVSGTGNLLISVFLAEYSLPLTWIPHWIALSLVELLKSLGLPAERIRVKWPNDVVIDGIQKIAGILCEKNHDGVVVGVGVNLNQKPENLDRPSASLKGLLQVETVDVSSARDLWIKILMNEPNLESLKREYEKYSLLKKGDPIYWLDLQSQKSGQGIFQSYGDHGELKVIQDGSSHTLFSEEIHLVKSP